MSLPAFNRVLSSHLAVALSAGAACDEDLVERCYSAAARDVELPGRHEGDPLAAEIRTLCVAHDLDILRAHEPQLRQLSLTDAATEIFRLLNPDLRVAGVESEDFLF